MYSSRGCGCNNGIDVLITNKHKVHIQGVETVLPSTTAPTMTTTSVVVSTASAPYYDPSLQRVPTSSELITRGNDKGTDLLTSHANDECLVDLNTPCDALATTLITPPILDDYADDLTLPCDYCYHTISLSSS